MTETADMLGAYRLLTACIICPAKTKPIRAPLSMMERRVWQWICGAGLSLTSGELVKLFSEEIHPIPDLLGKENAQALTMALYAAEAGFNSALDTQMEQAPERDAVVNAVLGLLRKKRIILI